MPASETQCHFGGDLKSSPWTAALAALADAIWEYRPTTGELCLSPRCYTMLGYAHQQLPMSVETVRSLCHPEDLQAALDAVGAILQSPHSQTCEAEFRLRSAQGSWCWISARCRVVERGADGQALFVVGSNTNVTDRKRAEEVLAEHEHRFRVMIQNINDTLLIMKPSGEIEFASPSCLALTGYPARELTGSNLYDLIHTEDRGWVSASIQNSSPQTDRGVALEFRYLHNDGTVRWVEVCGTNLVDDPTIGGLILAARDITRRRQSELETLEWKLRYELLALATGNVVYDLLSTGEIKWGGGVEEAFGYGTRETQGGLAQWLSRVHPDDRQRAAEHVRAAQNAGSSFNLEYRVKRKDGHYVLVQDTGYPYFGADGGVEHFIGVLSDITRRKKADEENARLTASLQQAQKMESIGRLAGGVAHDFNNLLTVISANVSFATMELQEHDPLYESMQEINSAVESAAALTRQLLAFSRKQVIDPRVLNLNTVVERMHRMLTRLLGEDVELNSELDESLGQVRLDPGQVEQLIVNLAVNARDAMPVGGRLTLRTANVTLDESRAIGQGFVRSGDYVMLAVSDNGSGMDEETKTHLFEPFFTTKELGKGTGLGLATVYGIVTQNEGIIEVSSELHCGTTFEIYWPRVDAEPEAFRDQHTSRLPRGAETIMLVEDEDMVREVAARLLRRQGYRVLAYANGGEAMMAAREMDETFHLLITDVVMPGINGRVLAQNLREIRPGLKVLFTSGYTGEVIMQHGILKEDIEFMAKPYTLELLAKRVREVLDSGSNGRAQP